MAEKGASTYRQAPVMWLKHGPLSPITFGRDLSTRTTNLRTQSMQYHQNELLKQRIYKDNKVYTSLNTLEAAWYTAWHELSLEDVNECILGLPARIQKVYENEGRNNRR